MGFEYLSPVPYMKLNKKFTEIKRVVIDPGHGGKDPGAIGTKGLLEKNVVLAEENSDM